MALLQFTLLLVFLTECCGETRFIYKTKDKEEKLRCETNKWQISTKSDNRIDLCCSVQCKTGKTVELDDDDDDDDDDIKKICSKDKVSRSLEVKKSGFYSCVKSLDPGRFLFPFKSSPNNVIQSYIIAVQNSDLTLEPERRSSVNVSEGGSVILNCSFRFKPGYNKKPFTVYWIKTVNQSSTCIYSYDRDGLNHHCDEQKKLGKRLLNLNTGQLNHDIKISEVKSSDSGQYRCALQMDTSVKKGKSKVKWKVIENVTLRVYNPTPPHSTDQPETPTIPEKPETPETPEIPEKPTIPETPTIPKTPKMPETPETTNKPTENTKIPEERSETLKTTEGPTETTKLSDVTTNIAVYVGVSVLLCVLLLLVGVFVFIRKRRFLSAGCKTVQQQRNQDALDGDCSPYAVGRGDHEYDSIKSPSTTADPDHKQPSAPLEPYSVVRLNDLYDSSASENVQHPV
ncbi:hypothetical protein AMEX_G26281 [Astyanax mexicanus]|uniref:Ig-like domain-containing protein n=1 Tax=Astyanax mexicanus TaxID=7994 RepID=A0A8T2KNP3_ASTMX|nr:hypothetical protein AMEX_G26281 [Astyanax mexicanus]